MRAYSPFRQSRDYAVPLLELLAEFPGLGAEKGVVLSEFAARYEDVIPDEHHEEIPSVRRPRWAYWVDWQRNELHRLGFIDSPRWGVWRITPAGLQWLEDNPEATLLDPGPRAPSQGGERPRAGGAAPSREVVSGHFGGRQFTLSREQVLGVARDAIAHGLPPEAARYHRWVVLVDGQRMGLRWLFCEATGLQDGVTSDYARDVLGRRLGLTVVDEENPRPPGAASGRGRRRTDGEEHRWLDAIRREVRAIRELLTGRAARPSDERLCDLVQLCYTLGLYEEARDLFALVDPGAVNAWWYERTQKLARVCALRTDA